MREILREWICAGLPDVWLHSSKIWNVEVKPRKILPRQIFRDNERHKRLVLICLAKNMLPLSVGKIDEPADLIHRHADAACRLFGYEEYSEILPIVCQLDTETVMNATARRRNQPLTDPIFLRPGLELIAFQHFELVETTGKYGKNGGHSARHHQGASRESGVTALVLGIEQRHQNSLRSGPTTLC